MLDAWLTFVRMITGGESTLFSRVRRENYLYANHVLPPTEIKGTEYVEEGGKPESKEIKTGMC